MLRHETALLPETGQVRHDGRIVCCFLHQAVKHCETIDDTGTVMFKTAGHAHDRVRLVTGASLGGMLRYTI